MNAKYPPQTTAALVSYNHLGPFSEVVPAEKMAELERAWNEVSETLRLQNEALERLARKQGYA